MGSHFEQSTFQFDIQNGEKFFDLANQLWEKGQFVRVDSEAAITVAGRSDVYTPIVNNFGRQPDAAPPEED